MDFTLNDEYKAIKDMTRDFVNHEIAPIVRKYDEEERFPVEVMDQLRENGLFNLCIPEEYGGPGIDKLAHAIVVEELARGCAGITTSAEANSLSSYPLLVGGSEEQKKKYFERLTHNGEYASFALTEPGAGSDVSSMKTKAEKVGDEYVLNGEKCFITNASYAHFFVLLAKLVDESGEPKFTAFVVERDSEGIIVGEKEKKMGLRASDTASVILEDVKVPEENRIGAEGEGFKIFMKALSQARPMVGAQAVGIAQGAFEAALDYSQERKQFGKEIGKHQAIQFMLADMAMTTEASRLLVYKSANLLMNGKDSTVHASYAKCFSSDTAMKVATDAVQIFGGYGFIREYPVEKYLRDAKIMQIYEGTNQIQRVVIAKSLLNK